MRLKCIILEQNLTLNVQHPLVKIFFYQNLLSRFQVNSVYGAMAIGMYLVKKFHNDKLSLLKVFIHLLSLVPLINLYYCAFTDLLAGDPVEKIIHFTGLGAFNLLLITLCISPLAKQFKQAFIIKTRRLLGLYTFFYASLHLVSYLIFDLQSDLSLFLNEVIKRPFINVGMVAFFFLLTLAVTSYNKIKRQMGRSWQGLHNTIYLIVLLVGIHFYWSVKSELTTPLVYLFLTFILLLLRYKKIQMLVRSLFMINKK